MVTHEEILQVAQLSNLHIAEEQIPTCMAEIAHMVALADQIARVTEAAPIPQPLAGIDAPPLTLAYLREDVVAPSLSTAQTLQNLPDAKDGYFPARRRLL